MPRIVWISPAAQRQGERGDQQHEQDADCDKGRPPLRHQHKYDRAGNEQELEDQLEAEVARNQQENAS